MEVRKVNIRNYEDIYKDFKLEEKEKEIENILKIIKKYKKINENTKILEVGTGNGWFQISCKKKSLNCEGIDIVQSNIEFANKLGKKYGYNLNIKLGSIENTDIGENKYDIIIALAVFEHVLKWEQGIKNIYKALKPKGLFLFLSTNKFALKSEEYDFPFYGWFPNKIRYHLRTWKQGPKIMKCGIDFHQFTYQKLIKTFQEVGFRLIHTPFEFFNINYFNSSKLYKIIFIIGKKIRFLRNLILAFMPLTYLITIK